MSLPVYHHINLNSASLDNLTSVLSEDMNLKHPVAINVKPLTFDEQREIIGLIENHFVSQNLSFKFPYPIYLITDHERSISKIPLVNEIKELPRFYIQKESRMNVKEAHLAGKNKLLQQEIKNTDASANSLELETYGEAHRLIYEMELERKFYRTILNRLMKSDQNG